jgi:hypothetical protein
MATAQLSARERQKAFLMAEARDCIEGWEAEGEA